MAMETCYKDSMYMSNNKQKWSEQEDRHSTLLSNAQAVRAVTAAVEGTLGPKGLDTMLVSRNGDVIVTNDGVTILDLMEITHPAAKMLINIARAQQDEIGDGTTTATLLAGALVQEACAHVQTGVPVTRIIEGIQQGISRALEEIQARSRPLEQVDDPRLLQVARIAGREHGDIASLVVKAAQLMGLEKLRDPSFRLSEMIVSSVGATSEVFHGLLLNKQRMSPHMPEKVEKTWVFLLDDALEAEGIDEEALRTETGFQTYLQYKEEFRQSVRRLIDLGVRFICTGRGVSPVAEEMLTEAGVFVVQRVSSRDMRRLADYTGARPVKRTGLHKSPDELKKMLGWCAHVYQDKRMDMIRLEGGHGKPMATILVGATTAEVVGERARIAKDAASSVQAAVRGGIVPGGGALELYISRVIEKYREKVRGMAAYGVDAVAKALRRPMTQIVLNAGFNPLEKIEDANAGQIHTNCDSLAIDCESGEVVDMMKRGVLDPTLVKYHALKAAGEVAVAVLRIQTIVRMRSDGMEDQGGF
jgi:chaperonin GroEL (HSP60 family)